MTYRFTQRLPDDYYVKAILISGDDTAILSDYEFLVVEDEDTVQCFEIRYEGYEGPFEDAVILNNVLGVGFAGIFYLFDLESNNNLLRLEMCFYFGCLYVHQEHFLVADASGLYCINPEGKILWHNNNLGVDGVVVNDIAADKIFGSGEWDPPGGWEDFVLDRATGKEIG